MSFDAGTSAAVGPAALHDGGAQVEPLRSGALTTAAALTAAPPAAAAAAAAEDGNQHHVFIAGKSAS
jgi:hypothetical protein